MAEYIERDQAIRKAIDACIKVVGHGISQVSAVDIADEIDSIPAADVVEIRHGKWEQSSYHYSVYYCSECSRHIEDGSHNPNEHFPYCHCGAKMDGKSEDNA